MSERAYEAVRAFLSRVQNGGLNLTERRPDKIGRFVARIGVPVDPNATLDRHYCQQVLETLVRRAPNDPQSWCQCETLAATFVEAGRELPEPLKSFTARVLLGEITKPTMPADYKNSYRDAAIWGAVREAMLADSTLKLFRNVASKNKSACDIVADCLKGHGVSCGPDSVRKIYGRLESLRRKKQTKSFL